MAIFTDDQLSSNQAGSRSKKYPGPVAAGILFSLTTVLLTFGEPILKFKDVYLRSGMGELLFILLPVIILLIAGRYNIKNTLKLRGTRPVNYVLTVFIMIFAMPVVGVLNAIVLALIRLIFGRILPEPQIPISNTPTLFIAILVIGLSAAVCEEILFRGMIMKGFQKYGAAASLAVTSVLFGILHRDMQKAVSTILLGAIIGFIVYRTKSIYAGMTAHFTNNTVAVLLSFVSSKLYENMGGLEEYQNFDFSNIPKISLVIAVVFYGIMFMGLVSGLIALLYAFLKSTGRNVRTDETEPLTAESLSNEEMGRIGLPTIISLLPGIIIIAFTFVKQIFKLAGLS